MVTYSADQEAILGAPQLWQSVYNQQMGIPATGRSIYQNWLANQYGRAASAYSLGQIGQGPTTGWQPAVMEVDAEGRETNVVKTPAQWAGGGQSFRDWLPANTTTQNWGWTPTQFANFQGLSGQQQREFMERMPQGAGFDPQAQLIQSRFGQAGMPNWLSNQMTRQAQLQAPAWAVSPTGGLDTGPEAQSFLDYVFNRYGLGGGYTPVGGSTGPAGFRWTQAWDDVN